MKTIDLKIQDLKNSYQKNRKITLDNEVYFIGKLCGALTDWLLFKKGKQYLVYSDYKKQDYTFIIIN